MSAPVGSTIGGCSTTGSTIGGCSTTGSTIGTGAAWDELNDDNKRMISGYVRVNRINRLRLQRLTYRFLLRRTAPGDVFWILAQLKGQAARWGQPHDPHGVAPAYDGPRTEGLLRQFFDRSFRLAAAGPAHVDFTNVNITPAQWAQVVLRIEGVTRIDGPRGTLRAGDHALIVEAVSDPVPGQSRHRLRVFLPHYAGVELDANGEPLEGADGRLVTYVTDRPRATLEYSGFLRWRTFDDPNYGRLYGPLAEAPAAAAAAAPAAAAAAAPAAAAAQGSRFIAMPANPYTTGIANFKTT